MRALPTRRGRSTSGAVPSRRRGVEGDLRSVVEANAARGRRRSRRPGRAGRRTFDWSARIERIGRAMSAGIQSGGRHLVEQRLEQVVVASVDEGDVDECVVQRLGCCQAAEPSSDDDDVGPCVWVVHSGSRRSRSRRRTTSGSASRSDNARGSRRDQSPGTTRPGRLCGRLSPIRSSRSAITR